MELQEKKGQESTKESIVKDKRTPNQRKYIERLKKMTIDKSYLADKRTRPSSGKCEQWKLEQQSLKVPNHLRYVLEEMYPKETRLEI